MNITNNANHFYRFRISCTLSIGEYRQIKNKPQIKQKTNLQTSKRVCLSSIKFTPNLNKIVTNDFLNYYFVIYTKKLFTSILHDYF